MKNLSFFSLLLGLLVVISGCDNDHPLLKEEVDKEIARLKKASKEDPYNFTVHMTSMYDPDYGYINRKDRVWRDMILEPGIGGNGYSFSPYFYNYGGNIKLFNGSRDDCYIPLGHIQAMGYVEDLHDVTLKRILEDEKYGTYAIVDWEIGNRTFSNIYMTPLAYSAYRTRSGDDNLIFVQFVGDGKFMNVIFRGEYFERYMVQYRLKDIGDGLFPGAGKSGCGAFWREIN